MYKRILIVVDARAASRAAVKEGIAMAKAHGAEALFYSVLPSYPMPVADMVSFPDVSFAEFEDTAKETAIRLLAQAAGNADKEGVRAITATGKAGDDVKRIIDAALRRRCQMIVVASEGRNAFVRLMTGSVVHGLITASPVPVLVCKKAPKTAVPAILAMAAPAKPGRAKTKPVSVATSGKVRRTAVAPTPPPKRVSHQSALAPVR